MSLKLPNGEVHSYPDRTAAMATATFPAPVDDCELCIVGWNNKSAPPQAPSALIMTPQAGRLLLDMMMGHAVAASQITTT